MACYLSRIRCCHGAGWRHTQLNLPSKSKTAWNLRYEKVPFYEKVQILEYTIRYEKQCLLMLDVDTGPRVAPHIIS